MPVRSQAPVVVSLSQARLRKGGLYPTPCIDVCRMEPASGLCLGCSRTLEEIAGWGSMDEAARKACWERIEARQGTAALRG